MVNEIGYYDGGYSGSVAAWSLTGINYPSGGSKEFEYEEDYLNVMYSDYGFL